MSLLFSRLVSRALVAAAAIAIVAACGGSTTTSPDAPPVDGAAEVVLAFHGWPQDTMRIVISDTAALRLARAYVQTGRGPALPVGRIVLGAGVDARYPYHFQPETVRFADAAIELCDGAPMHTQQAVLEFMRGATGEANPTSATWCPWGAYPIAVR